MANVINGTATGNGGLISTGDKSGIINIQTNETTAVTVDASQNVGIGTTSPGSKLDVKGTLRLSGSTSGYVGLAPAAAAGSTTYTMPSADGTNGQLLSTNGSATLSWATVSASPIPTPDIKTTGSSATWTIPAGVTKVKVTMIGGGGGGGSGNACRNAGSGGGAGGYSVVYLTGLTAGNTLTYTVGAGGAADSSGGTTSLSSGTQTITTVTCTGGGGGASATSVVSGGAGGTATGGTLNISGGYGNTVNLTGPYGGGGGVSPFGGAGQASASTSAVQTASGYGSGGGGSSNGGPTTGGAGKGGVIIFEY